ncbi:aminomethyl-transferring glycine dehydrogenase subunit GcvPB [candidate division KSB1 bacterium]|nr:aminomethyl-transferring glycine dehydrogenase subunit GcvPB [candidate division KSB1 bacterium]
MQSESQLIFELSRPGRVGYDVPSTPREILAAQVPDLPRRKVPPKLPEVSENLVVRHYTNLSTRNHHIDKDFYPLGSCTMKYNPKINDELAGIPGFGGLHPFQMTNTAQGALEVLQRLSDALLEVTGMDAITLQPAAGAQGELTALLMFRAYHQKHGGRPRRRVIIPDSAHGTNPASIVIAGYEVTELKSGADGLTDIQALKSALSDDVAALMITNPNTVGLFESRIAEIIELVHSVGGLVYMDGANLNAMLGVSRPGDMGFDACHINLHKTFSTPHGGGGPGSGPVAVKSSLAPFLPSPVINTRDGVHWWDWNRPDSIGHVHSFYGNFGMHVRALAYVLSMGGDGLRAISENAIINANYLRVKLSGTYEVAYDRPCTHEVILSGDRQKARGAKTLDIAKRLLDYGYHPPTVYFPLIVHEALMLEPTESESRETLDEFIQVMLEIDREITRDPELLKSAPHTTPVRRLDEAGAARNLDIRYTAK